MRSVWLGVMVVLAACGSGNADRPGLPPAAGGSSDDTGGTESRAGNGSSGAGASSAAGDGTQGAEGGVGAGEGGVGGGNTSGGTTPVLEMGGAPPVEPPGVCNPSMKLGNEQAQDVGVADATLLSVTRDERTIAFTTGSGDLQVLHVADRDSSQSAFAEVTVTLPAGYDAKNGATLSRDGLQLVLVNSERSGFGALARAKRGDPFAGEADATAFDNINRLKPMTGKSVGWPLLSDDGKTLYYVSYSDSAYVMQCSRQDDGTFSNGTQIDEFTLGGPQGEHKLLSGLSADQRAIFFFDEKTQHAMALFRSRDGGPFYDPIDLGARRGAAPNADCTRVYSSVALGVVVQPVK